MPIVVFSYIPAQENEFCGSMFFFVQFLKFFKDVFYIMPRYVRFFANSSFGITSLVQKYNFYECQTVTFGSYLQALFYLH